MSIERVIAGVLTLTLGLGQASLILAESEISRGEVQIGIQEASIKEEAEGATDQITETSNLNDYLRIGLERNPELRMFFQQWRASIYHISSEFSLPDPQISYTDYSQESDKKEAYSVSQIIPWPEKLWIKKKKAVLGSHEIHSRWQAKRLEMISRITAAYYEYAYLSRAVLITRENMKLLKNFESVAQAKYASGLTKNQELLKIQVELGKLENELTSMEDLRSPLTARLNALLNLPEKNRLPWPPDSLEGAAMTGADENVSRLIRQIRSRNPELAAFAKNVESEQQEVKLAKRSYFPDFMVSVTQEKMRPTTMNGRKDPWMVMVSVNVPLWFGRVNAEIKESRASLEAAEAELENKKNELGSRLSLTHYKLRDALRQSRLYKDALIPKAVQTLNATKSAYEAGGMDFLSLIDAQRVLLDFQMAYYRHNADFYQMLAEIRALIGEEPGSQDLN